MRRQPTLEDVARWQRFTDKMKEASKLLSEAYAMIGIEILPSLDGNDTTSFDLIKKIDAKLEQARMAAYIEHPVEQHWSGGPKDAPWPNTLRWRYL
jgi:hypothetical protein